MYAQYFSFDFFSTSNVFKSLNFDSENKIEFYFYFANFSFYAIDLSLASPIYIGCFELTDI